LLFSELVEEIGIENCLGIVAVRHLKSTNKIRQTCNSRQEMEVAEKMRNMSPEELQELRNRIK
jgi:hypothetical protein